MGQGDSGDDWNPQDGEGTGTHPYFAANSSWKARGDRCRRGLRLAGVPCREIDWGTKSCSFYRSRGGNPCCPMQGIAELRGSLEAIGRVFFEHLQDDVVHRFWQQGIDFNRWPGRAVQLAVEHDIRRLVIERFASCQQFVHGNAQGVEVRSSIDRFASDRLLG